MGTVSTRAYEYPAAGSARPHAVQQVTGAAGQGTGAYGYDESGNQVSRPGQELTFNTVGKVSKVVAGSEVQSNVFDADGNLLLRVSSTDGATLFLGDTTLTQAAGSSVVAGFRTYSGAEGKPVAQRSAKTDTAGSVLTWLFTNLEGTVDVQTTANGSSTVQSYRDPFGAPIADSAQAWADGAGYMDKQVAKATALTNVGARTYDPALGKFVSVDPVIDTSLPQQNTGYAYSGNNPTTYKDPSGLRLTIGCEPYCGKGAATIAQKLTPRSPNNGKPSYPVSVSRMGSPVPRLLEPSALATASPNQRDSPGILYSSGTWTGSPQRIARDWGYTVGEVKSAIHALKDELKFPGANRNPDVEIDVESGDVRIKGGDGEPIGNLDDYFEESHWEPARPYVEIDSVFASAGIIIGIVGATVGYIILSPLNAATG